MYRYILSSDSVIARMESAWYKNLEKNNSIAQQYKALCHKYSCTSSSDIVHSVIPVIENKVSKVEGIKKVDVDISTWVGVDIDVYIKSVDYDSVFMFTYKHGAVLPVSNKTKSKPYYDQIVECVNDKDVLSKLNDYVEFKAALNEFPDSSDFSVALRRPVTATYFYLFRSLIRRKGQYLIQDDADSNVYYQITSSAKRVWSDAGDTEEVGYNVKVLNPSSDGRDMEVSESFVVSDDNKSDSSLFNSNVHLPTDGTFPTVVSREEAIPQKTLF